MTKIKTNIFKILLMVLGLVLTSSFFYSPNLSVNAEVVGGGEDEEYNGDYENYYSSYDNVSYSRMHITLDVKNDGVMKFTYDFDVCANSSRITEFYFVFPYMETIYRDTNSDGEIEEDRYYGKIYNETLVKGQDGNEVLKRYVDDVADNYITIGVKNPTGYYNRGDVRNYKVSFDYDMHFNYQDGFDEIYINLLGGTYLKLSNVSFTINLPKDVNFGEYKPYIYAGRMASNDLFDDFAINGNSISSTKTFDVYSGDALTYRQLLPQGYFNEREKESNLFVYLIIGTTILLALILVFLKLKSKPDKMAIPVQLEMPDMLPTDAELYGTNKITKKSIGATIIYLANKGFVKIETVGEKCEPNKLIKVKDLPADFDPKVKRIFERVFKNKKTEVFFDDFGSLSLYERMSQYKNAKESEYDKKAYTNSSRKRYGLIQALDVIFSIIPMAFFFLHLKTALGFMPDCVFIIVFMLISGATMYGSQAIRIPMAKIILCIISCMFALSSSVFVLQYSAFNSCVPVIISYILLFIVGIFPVYKHYNAETIENVRLVRGIKNYIEKVEKNRIETLVMENPTIYYDILPLAYVLGVSDKWISVFEDIIITPPTWLVGNNGVYVSFRPYHMQSVCRGITNNMNSFVNSSRAQKFASSSGGSGGFGGGGGGGFSGGGGGGASFGGR